jgi:ADP-ribose pyrophosphatase YjhB (NUDIX family)
MNVPEVYLLQPFRHRRTDDSLQSCLFNPVWASSCRLERSTLPDDFVHIDESVDAAARRELQEETGLQAVFLKQL